MITAKLMVDNKFWILEENGASVGTLQKLDLGYTTVFKGKKQVFKDKKSLTKFFGVNIFVQKKVQQTSNDNTVHGFVASTTPYNIVWDLKRKLPLFTKAAKSKSLFCAGYYIIKFEKGWVESFCPKSITLNKYEYKGPFRTQLEMRSMLNHER